MKTDIHPKGYRKVIFVDATSGERFLIGSTVSTRETGSWDDGKEYPLVTVEISSASHPVYTGKEVTIDTAGRVDKFKKRMEASGTKRTAKK
jgi:large subunit ribosomal protein L31